MIDIKINITNKIANAIGTPFIVCGNSDYTVTFTFDAEWGAYQEKTARFFFVSDGIEQYIDVLFSGNTCNAPVLPNIEKVLIGVYTGNLRTTTGAEVRCKRSILFGGKVHEPPTTEDVYNEILEIVSKKLGSEGGTVTGDYYKDGNTFIHEGNLDLLDETDNLAITKTASGSAITIDSASAPLQNLKLFGKTEQNGTPTPSAPVPLVSVGDSGSFEVGVYGNNFWDMNALTIGSGGTYNTSGDTITFSGYENLINYFPFGIFVSVIPNTNYTLSFKATSLNTLYIYTDWYFGKQVGKYDVVNGKVTFNSGNHTVLFLGLYSYSTSRTGTSETVSNIMLNIGIEPLPYEPCNKQTLTMPYILPSVTGVQDEIDFAKGVRFNKVGIYKSLISNADIVGYGGGLFSVNTIYNFKEFAKISCNMFVEGDSRTINNAIDTNRGDKKHPYFRCDGFETVDAFKSAYGDKEIVIHYELETPQEIPLTETELNAYRHLYTNKGNTTVLSECEDTEITYYINKPNAQAIGNIHTQVNNDYFKLQQAIISLGGN